MKKKRILSAILAVAMAVSLCCTQVFADGLDGKTFSGWAQNGLSNAATEKLIPYKELPNDYTEPITRGQFCALAAVLCESLKHTELPYDANVFTDVADTDTAILKMAKAGIISGYGSGLFGTNDALTREQAAAILTRVCESMGGDLTVTKTNAFTDKFSTWAVEPVSKVYSAGIMSGYSAAIFGAKDSYTVEQSIITMFRVYGSLSDDMGVDGPQDFEDEIQVTTPSEPADPEKPETASRNICTLQLNDEIVMVKGTNGRKMTTVTIRSVWDQGDLMQTVYTINADHTVTCQNIRLNFVYDETTYDGLIIKDASGKVVFDSAKD